MQFDRLRRRDFITLLGGAATWPLVAGAQQPEQMRRIGVLMPWAADNPVASARIAAFQHELQQLGWTAGRNIRFDTRWAAGNTDETRKQAAELVALAPDVILAGAAVKSFARSSDGGLIVAASIIGSLHHELTATLAARYRLPAVYSDAAFVTVGGLISYGPLSDRRLSARRRIC